MFCLGKLRGAPAALVLGFDYAFSRRKRLHTQLGGRTQMIPVSMNQSSSSIKSLAVAEVIPISSSTQLTPSAPCLSERHTAYKIASDRRTDRRSE